MFGLALIVLLVLFAILGPLLSGDPLASDFSAARSPTGGPPGPSAGHPLGTDPLFRDVLSRLAHGARLSLVIATSATILAMVIGGAIGVTAGYVSNSRWHRVDNALMRLVDIALAFPYLLLITAIGVAVDRADAVTVILILGITSWTGIARVARAKTLQTMSLLYVQASHALGAGPLHVIRKHILPAIAPTMLVIGSQAIAGMILAEAVLSYLTVGIEPPHATWGRMLHEAETYIGAEPLLVAAPGLAILIAVLGFTRLGDGLADALDTRSSEPPKRAQRWRYLADVVIVVGAIVVVGVSGHESLKPPTALAAAADEDKPRRGGILHVATSGDIHTLDPAVAYDEASRAVADPMFAKLVAFDYDGKIVGDLAKRFEIRDGGKEMHFVLREDLRFHDMTPLSASDVKRSLERTLHPKTPCPAAHLYRHIRGYQAFVKDPKKGLAGVIVDTELSLRIVLDEPNASFLSLLALDFAAPVCKSSGRFVDPKAPKPPCGAGPFKLQKLEPGERITLSRFEAYHVKGKPYLDGMLWELAVPPLTQRYRFERGELHFLNELPGIDVFRFSADERWAPHRHWAARPITHSIFLNLSLPPFDNRHMRRAVAFAVDPTVLEKVRATVAATTRLIPPAVPGPPREPPLRRHDIDRALKEMELAGYPYDPLTDSGGWPEPIDYITVPDTFEQAAAEVFQQQLARIGLRVRLKLVAWATLLSTITQPGRAQMGWRGWQADHPAASTFFEPILTSAAIQKSGSQNVSFFKNSELDEVVDQARRQSDHSKRMALWQRAEEIVHEQAPLVPVYTQRSLQVQAPQVRGYKPHPVISLRVKDVWLR